MAFLAFRLWKKGSSLKSSHSGRRWRLGGLRRLWKWNDDAPVFSGPRTSFLVTRIANSRAVYYFFVLAIIHFIIHVVLQTFILITDITKHSTITDFADLPKNMFVSFEDGRWLKGCNATMDVKAGFDGRVRGCPVLFDAAIRTVLSGGRAISVADASNLATSTTTQHGLCDTILLWAYQTFHNEVRTDGSFIALEAWLLFVSIAAIASESVPHIIASTLIRLLSTGWSLWAILETNKHRMAYRTLVKSPISPCAIYANPQPGFLAGMDRIPDLDSLFMRRMGLDVVVFALNLFMLLVIAALSLKIYKIYQEQHFEHVGASDEVQRMYKWLTLHATSLHLSSYVVVVSISLWIDRLFSMGGYHLISEPLGFYQIISVAMGAIAVCWLALGHIGIRREMRRISVLFIVGGLVLIAAYLSLMTSVTFRTFFATWSFFSTICFASFALILMALIVGMICRRNFGKGLKHYLHVRRVLANSHFTAESFTDTSRPTSESHFIRKLNQAEEKDLTMKSFIQQPQPIKLPLGNEDVRRDRVPAIDFDSSGRMLASRPFNPRISIAVGEAEVVAGDDYKTWVAYDMKARDDVEVKRVASKKYQRRKEPKLEHGRWSFEGARHWSMGKVAPV